VALLWGVGVDIDRAKLEQSGFCEGALYDCGGWNLKLEWVADRGSVGHPQSAGQREDRCGDMHD